MKFEEMRCEDIASQMPLYLSGELDDPARVPFEAHLADCARCDREAGGLRQLDSHLRRSVLAEPLATAAIERQVRRQIATRPTVIRWAAAAAVVLAVAGASTFLSSAPAKVPEVYTAALQDHHRELIEKQPRPWVSDSARVEQLAAEQGVSAPVLAQLAPEGYRLEHGKLCRLNGRAYLHLVYENDGQQVSLFLRKGEALSRPEQAEGQDRKFLYSTTLGHEHLATVQAGELSIVYVAGDGTEVSRMAEQAAAVL